MQGHKTPSSGYIGRPDFSISRTIGSFNNNDGKKAKRLETTTLQLHHAFL